jgi:hypothetical protein
VAATLAAAALTVPASVASAGAQSPPPVSLLAAAPWHLAAPAAAPRARAIHTPRRRRAVTLVTARGGASLALHSRPGGRVAATLGPVTEFGSRTVLPVLTRRGRWLGAPTSELPNAHLGWIDSRARGVRLVRSPVSIRVHRARRLLELRIAGHTALRTTVGVGSAASPTPAGRFAVTDKLPGARFSAAYGCCVLALSAHQTHPPAGWSQGTRMAIHGTDAPSTIGAAASAGCVHAPVDALRVLMRRVPLGTPVLID